MAISFPVWFFEPWANVIEEQVHLLPPSSLAEYLGVGATLGVAVALGISGSKRRALDEKRGRQQAMTDAHLRLTTGEVARARNEVGGLMALGKADAAACIRQSPGTYISAFYTLLWALESIDNSRMIWVVGPHDSGESTFLKWNEAELNETVPKLRSMLMHELPGFEESSRTAEESLAAISAEREEATIPAEAK